MKWHRSRLAQEVLACAVFGRGSRRHAPRYRSVLRVEPLENRCVPSTITPTTFADGGLGSGSLRDAVLQFNADTGTDDDIIQLEAGTYALTIRNPGGRHETAGLTGDLNLTQTSHRLIIQGTGSSGDNKTIIDASQLQDRVLQIVTPGTQLVFQELIIQGGLAQDDGSNDALAGTTDALGGGVLNDGGNVTLDNVVLQNNFARGGDGYYGARNGHNAIGGGLYSTGGALTIDGATMTNNRAIGGRGASAYMVVGDGGSAEGAGLYATASLLDISDSTIANNQATGGRGGDGFTTHMSYTVYHGGTGGFANGAGLYVNGGALTISTSHITTNQGIGGLGGLYGHDGPGQGGGLYNSGTLMVSNSTLSGNLCSYAGGGIANYGTLTVSNSNLAGNIGGGGGIYNIRILTVNNSTLSGNIGGGIINYGGTLMISNSTLSGNTSVGTGGGIWNLTGTRSILTNVTLTANRSNVGGGGLFVYPDFSVAPVLHNTLIAGNFRGVTGTTRDDVYGNLDTGGDYNLIGDGTGMTGLSDGVNGNLVGSSHAPIDPLLGALQDNGGPTQTHALLEGSPAIDAGNNAYATDWDQRGEGFPRIVNSIIDIGAFEVQDGGAAHRGRSLVNRVISADIAVGPEVSAPTDGTTEPAVVTTTDQTKRTVAQLPQPLAPSATAPANDYARSMEVLDAFLGQLGPEPLAGPIADGLTLATVL
jgi:hypothetical protein